MPTGVVHRDSNSGKVGVVWRSPAIAGCNPASSQKSMISDDIKNASLPESDYAARHSQVDGTARTGQADTQAHHTSHEVRRLACKPEYPRGESCLRWCRLARPHARGNLGVYAEEDVIRNVTHRSRCYRVRNVLTESHTNGVSVRHVRTERRSECPDGVLCERSEQSARTTFASFGDLNTPRWLCSLTSFAARTATRLLKSPRIHFHSTDTRTAARCSRVCFVKSVLTEI
jgi:hypothetical protein